MDPPQTVHSLEIDGLLEGIFQQSGCDFRGYERHAIVRKVLAFMQLHSVTSVSSLQDQALQDRATGSALLKALGPSAMPLFHNPLHWRELRRVLAPCLRSFPLPLIWVAECGGLGVACTVAILLEEAQLGSKVRIFATSANESIVQEAGDARLESTRDLAVQDEYRESGGMGRIADYCRERAGQALLLPSLWNRILWAQHNVVTDASFNEFQLIVCRGTLGNYGPLLRHRVLQLFYDSLSPFGLLSMDGLSDWERERYCAGYKVISGEHGLYMRIG